MVPLTLRLLLDCGRRRLYQRRRPQRRKRLPRRLYAVPAQYCCNDYRRPNRLFLVSIPSQDM